MIISVMGLPGSGKTYFAKALSSRYNISHLNTDQVRNELMKRGRYSDQNKEEIYSELYNRVEKIIEEKRDVIVDATFSKKSNRAILHQLSIKHNASLKWIEVHAEESRIKERLKKPRPDSEADFDVYQIISEEFDTMDEDHLVLASDRLSIDDMIDEASEYLGIE